MEADSGAPVTLVAEPPAEVQQRRLPAVLVPLGFYVVSRVMTLFAGAVAMALRPGATFTRIFASWDGTWYELIVREGYPSVIPARHGEAIFSQVPFFPAYPLMVKVVDWLTPGGADMAGIVVSLVLGAVASIMFWYLCRSFWGDTVATRGVALFCFFPGAWVFSFAYSEGLMIILAIGTLVLLQRRGWVGAGGVRGPAAGSRPDRVGLGGGAGGGAGIAVLPR